MTPGRKILWWIFPLLSFLSWAVIAGVFTQTLPDALSFLVVLAIPFYLGALLFTIPLNIFTLIALLRGRQSKEKKEEKQNTYYTIGCVNFLVSLIWAISIFGFDWILTA